MIVLNQAKCLDCGDLIFSAHRHDFQTCSCENLSVDGGMDYIRRAYATDANIQEMSLELPDVVVNRAVELAKWAMKTGRNERGLAYAVIRALHEHNYIVTDKKEN